MLGWADKAVRIPTYGAVPMALKRYFLSGSYLADTGFDHAYFANDIPLCRKATQCGPEKLLTGCKSVNENYTNHVFTGLTMTAGPVEQNVVNIVLKLAVELQNSPNFIAHPL